MVRVFCFLSVLTLAAGAALGQAKRDWHFSQHDWERQFEKMVQHNANDWQRQIEELVQHNVGDWLANSDKWLLAQNKLLEVFPASSGSYLGVGVEEIDSTRAKELKLKEERGVEIRRVEPDSPAEKAGLKEHDVVLEYNGQRVEGAESFIRMVRETPVGRTAKLQISRDGNLQTLTATIGRRKSEDWSRGFKLAVPAFPPIEVPRAVMTLRTSRVGLETEPLSGQLAEFFGVKEGVLVRSVDKDSPADKAGLKAGDVIMKADNESIRQPRDLSEQLRYSRDKKTLQLHVVRNHKEVTLNLELPERPGTEIRRKVSPVRGERL